MTIFVQGGTAGTADDSIVSLGDLSGDGLVLQPTTCSRHFRWLIYQLIPNQKYNPFKGGFFVQV